MSLLFTPPSYAQSVCATVKIQIEQELALERQAFYATLTLNNPFTDIALTDFALEVIFEDEFGASVLASSDPNNTTASFFIAQDSISGVTATDGTGVVSPNSNASIRYLIIPAPGAGGSSSQAKLYSVGARVSYTQGDQDISTLVTPDTISVKPLPSLTLDYFITKDVYADDPFTTQIEPPVPYKLAVRLSNTGFGDAKSLKIESAQPKIVENDQGLLIDFKITGSYLLDKKTDSGLLINFEDVLASQTKTAYWVMTSSLSGQFTEFSASYTHSDELGGKLTSLIDSINTHFLVKDVIASSSGSITHPEDSLKDFLAKDGDFLKLYYSNSSLSDPVSDMSAVASISPLGGSYQLTSAPDSGHYYVKIADPFSGTMQVGNVVRSDGYILPPSNAWLSKERGDNDQYSYYLNIFDTNTTGNYSIAFSPQSSDPTAPVIAYTGDWEVTVGDRLTFIVQASDPDGPPPAIYTENLPSGASFTTENSAILPGNTVGEFDWTPEAAGEFPVRFIATDGESNVSALSTITVLGESGPPTSEPPLPGEADWGFGNIKILSPLAYSEIANPQPTVVLAPPVNAQQFPDLEYEYELYKDPSYLNLLSRARLSESSWSIGIGLEDNSHYYLRARPVNGEFNGRWEKSEFFVNTFNEPPNRPNINTPWEVSSPRPVFTGMISDDVDDKNLNHFFRISLYDRDTQEKTFLTVSQNLSPNDGNIVSWQIPFDLEVGQTYLWGLIAVDEHGVETPSNGRLLYIIDNYPDVPLPVQPSIIAPLQNELVSSFPVLLHSDVEYQPLYGYRFVASGTKFASSDTLYFGINGNISPTDMLNQVSLSSYYFTGTEPQEDQRYYWWAFTRDYQIDYLNYSGSEDTSFLESNWSFASFVYSTQEDPPSIPTVRHPANYTKVDIKDVVLSLEKSIDPEDQGVSYEYEIYGFDNPADPIISYTTVDQEVIVADYYFAPNRWFFWRARAVDFAGLKSDWTKHQLFFVEDSVSTLDFQFLEPNYFNDMYEVNFEDWSEDSNAKISLWLTDASSNIIPLVSNLNESEDNHSDSNRYVFNSSILSPGENYQLHGKLDNELTAASLTVDGPSFKTSGDKLDPTLEKISLAIRSDYTDTILETGSSRGQRTVIEASLNEQPTKNVKIELIVSNLNGITVSRFKHTFPSNDNWAVKKPFVIYSVPNAEYTADTTYQFKVIVEETNDPNYLDAYSNIVTVTRVDSDENKEIFYSGFDVNGYDLVRQKQLKNGRTRYYIRPKLTNTSGVSFSSIAMALAPYDGMVVHTKRDRNIATFSNVSPGETVLSDKTIFLDSITKTPDTNVFIDFNSSDWSVSSVQK